MGDARFEPLGYGYGRTVPGGTFEYLPAAGLLAVVPPAQTMQRASALRSSLRQLHHHHHYLFPGGGSSGGGGAYEERRTTNPKSNPNGPRA